MPPKDLGETCVYPATRQLVQISVDDIEMAENAVTKLMGKDVTSRKIFYQTHGEIL